MRPSQRNPELHYTHRVGWLRAAVLGADDGIVSTAALMVGVAAAHSARGAILLAGVAGLVAGAMSMAAGEYVSVSSQADTEQADLVREQKELAEAPEAELRELQQIYVERGLDSDLALEVATQLSKDDTLAAHARDELGITDAFAANPIQSAIASAATFSVGGALPLVVATVSPASAVIPVIAITSLACLAVLGALAARAGGAGRLRGAMRVTFWSALALGVTALVGHVFAAKV